MKIIKIIKTGLSCWRNHKFEFILGACVVFILLFSLFRKIAGKRGTWSKVHYHDGTLYNNKGGFRVVTPGDAYGRKITRAPPTESKGELECRRVLQYLFNRPFDKARPDFLRNPVTGGNFNLELDCFEALMRLAVEYNGQQHYKYLPYFHKNKEAFRNQMYRDDMKRRMCKEVGVIMIEVPYTVKIPEIKGFLEHKLRAYGFKV